MEHLEVCVCLVQTTFRNCFEIARRPSFYKAINRCLQNSDFQTTRFALRTRNAGLTFPLTY
jgi:hypothetical protein